MGKIELKFEYGIYDYVYYKNKNLIVGCGISGGKASYDLEDGEPQYSYNLVSRDEDSHLYDEIEPSVIFRTLKEAQNLFHLTTEQIYGNISRELYEKVAKSILGDLAVDPKGNLFFVEGFIHDAKITDLKVKSLKLKKLRKFNET